MNDQEPLFNQCPKCLSSFKDNLEEPEICCPRCGYSANGFNTLAFTWKYLVFREDNLNEDTKLTIIKVQRVFDYFYLIRRSDGKEMEVSRSNPCWFRSVLGNLFADESEDPFLLVEQLAEFAMRNGLLIACPMEKEEPRCPECGSKEVWQDGLYSTPNEKRQRFLCRTCGYRFSQHLLKSEALGDKCRIGVPKTTGMENLTSVQKSPIEKAGGATTKTDTATIKGKIIDFGWKLQREGYSDATISCYTYILFNLVKKGADLYNPDNIKDIIAVQKTWSVARKNIVTKAYTSFLKIQGLDWKKPDYKPTHKLPFIPLEKEIDDLIAGCGSRQMSTFLQLLKETAIRCGEGYNLKWEDIDLVSNVVRVVAEKGSEPRVFKISNALATMLSSLPKDSPKARVFRYKSMFYVRRSFTKQRKRITHKLGNPRLLQIHFHTFRHWKATTLYHQTKDILYVMQFLGHKNIKNTLLYIRLAEMISKNTDEYICKAANTVDEAKALIETGFEFVTDMNNYKLFRKRK